MKNRGLIFLLVGLASLSLIVLVALFFFYPKENSQRNQSAQATPVTSPAPTSPDGLPAPNEFDPVEWTRNPQTVPISPVGPGQNGTSGTVPGQNDFVVTLPPAGTQNTGLPKTLNTKETSFPNETASPTAKPTVRPTTAVKSPIPKASETKPVKPVKIVKVTEYWIQVGAYKDRFQAENAAKTLETQGLKGNLFTAQVAGQSVVRVRVGPYANQDEAKKFLDWLKPVKGFEGSYIAAALATKAQ